MPEPTSGNLVSHANKICSNHTFADVCTEISRSPSRDTFQITRVDHHPRESPDFHSAIRLLTSAVRANANLSVYSIYLVILFMRTNAQEDRSRDAKRVLDIQIVLRECAILFGTCYYSIPMTYASDYLQGTPAPLVPWCLSQCTSHSPLSPHVSSQQVRNP